MRPCTDAFDRNWLSWLVLALIVLLACHPIAAHATSAGGNLPWDGPLTTLKNDITGPVAFTISLLAMVACGAALVFGGEINEFIRRIIMLVLVAALITGRRQRGERPRHHRGRRVSLRRLPFHRVLHRPSLFLGGEREPALMTLILAGGLAVSGMNTVSCSWSVPLLVRRRSTPALDGQGRSTHVQVYLAHVRSPPLYRPLKALQVRE